MRDQFSVFVALDADRIGRGSISLSLSKSGDDNWVTSSADVGVYGA